MLVVKKLRDQTGYLYRATAELANTYGPVVGLRVGKDRQVVCYGYAAIKEMLTKEELDGRPQGPFYETRTWGTRRGNNFYSHAFQIIHTRHHPLTKVLLL